MFVAVRGSTTRKSELPTAIRSSFESACSRTSSPFTFVPLAL